MSIQNINRWAWLALGAIVGLLFFAVQSMKSDDWKQYGELINQRQFETALRKVYAGQPAFRNLVLYPQRFQEVDGMKTIYLIAGEYADRQEMRGGQLEANWKRKYFVASTPYQPLAAGRMQAEPVDSVIAYLTTVQKSYPSISWRIAWWKAPKWNATIWIGGWVLGLGIVWPCVINLIYYRRLLRPREPKGMDLSQVSSQSQTPVPPAVSEADLEKVRELEATLEAKLATEAKNEPAVVAAPSPQPAAVRQLGGTALAPVAVGEGEQREYGKDEDDFYPTERHVPVLGPDGHADASTPQRGGFTLVELLVVIGIVAILISLLMPAIAAVQVRGKELQCQTTLRSIGMAARIHANDHRGYLPVVGWQHRPIGGVVNPAGLGDSERKRYTYYEDNGVTRPTPITAALAMSMGLQLRTDSRENLEADLKLERVRKLFYCPLQEVQPESVTMGDGRDWKGIREASSYIFNEAALSRRDKDYAFPQGHLSQIRRPSVVFMAMDGRPRTDYWGVSVFDLDQDCTMWTWESRIVFTGGTDALDRARHRFRANVLFLDFHVESVPLTPKGLDSIGISRGIYQ